MSNVQSITEFYDSIAAEYNGHMTRADKKVRESVHNLLASHLSKGNILDFGGGTGLDIPWFLEDKYLITFVEPSERMRSIAHVNHVSKEEVTFVEINTDFNKWKEGNMPFDHKVNGILANFAVLNCIGDIQTLFEKFNLVSSADCRIVATVIDPGFRNMVRHYSFFAALRMLLQSRLTIFNTYKDQVHPTYIHSLASIKKASSKHFILESITPLELSSFAVLIFRKK